MNTPKPTKEQLRELAALKHNVPINTLLTAWRKDLGDALVVNNDDSATKRLQGATRAIDALVTLIETAQSELNKIK